MENFNQYSDNRLTVTPVNEHSDADTAKKKYIENFFNNYEHLPILNSSLMAFISSVLANILYTLRDSASVQY